MIYLREEDLKNMQLIREYDGSKHITVDNICGRLYEISQMIKKVTSLVVKIKK